MCFELGGVKVTVRFWFVAAAVLMLLLDTSGVMLCAFLSSAVHELAHLTALLAVKGEIISVCFEAFGIKILRKDTLLVWEEVIVLLAGPAANLMIFIICMGLRTAPGISLIAAVNLSIALFNLLPVGALDGGRVSSVLLLYAFGEKTGRRAARAVSAAFILPLLLLGIWLAVRPGHNFSLLLVCAFLIFSLIAERREDALGTLG